MSQQQEVPTVPFITQRGGIPIPMAPRKKAALLIAIILFDLLSITFAALSLPFYSRHEGYGRRGAWARPWNQEGPSAGAIMSSTISVITFGCHSFSELHPRHVYYTREGLFLGACAVFFLRSNVLVEIVRFARHFLKFGKEGDFDAYWLGVWTVCMLSAIVASLATIMTYLILCGKAMKKEEAEATIIDEISEANSLLRTVVITPPQISGQTAPEIH